MRLTEHMILARSKQSDLSTIKRINLWGCELTDISIVRNMTNIEVLALSVNNLSCLQPLEACTKLQELYLRKNNIQDFNQLSYLQNLPALTHLWLAENPCCMNAGTSYRACVVRMLPNLKKLDEEMITAEDIELSKKLDFKLETDNVIHNVPIDEQIRKQNSERKTQPQAESMLEPMNAQQSNTLEQFIDQHVTIKQSQNILLSEEQLNFSDRSRFPQTERFLSPVSSMQDSIALSPEKPSPPLQEPYLKQQISQSGITNRLSHGEESQLSNDLPRLELYNTTEPISAKPRSSSTLPLAIPRSDNEPQMQQDAIRLNRTHSLSQIPQLNLVLQIHHSQQGLEMPLDIPRSVSMQTINECPEPDKLQRNQNFPFGGAGDETARSKHEVFWEDGSHTSRSRLSESYPRRSGTENVRSNTARPSKDHQRFFDPDTVPQTARSRYSTGANSNLCLEDDLHSDRNSARSTTTLSTSQSNRRRNANVLSALLCIVPELDVESLQVLEHSIQCRIDELSME